VGGHAGGLRCVAVAAQSVALRCSKQRRGRGAAIAVTKWRSLLEGLVGSASASYSELAVAEDASASAKNVR
jgi:hypothetical protein